MARLSKEQRIFVLTSYFETKSFKTVKQKVLQRFPNVPIPVNSTIMQLIAKFENTGNMADKQWPGRKKSETMGESIDPV